MTIMAVKLRTFDFGRASTLTSSEKATYPWSEWLDGDIWQLTYGEDFHTHPLMMERIIRTRATGRRAKVRMRHLPANGNGTKARHDIDDSFGIIVLQRHDIKGPNELQKEAVRNKRAEKKAAAEKAAQETLAKAGIKPSAKKGSTKPTKTPSKRPVRKVSVAA